MAEVFGVITGAISVGSLAIQIFDSVKQLQSFCKAVKNAPQSVVDILEELELLAGMLIDLKSDLNQDDLASPKDLVARQSLEYCVRVGQDLELILVDLGKGMMSSGVKRRWTMLKTANGSDRIQGYLKRLERAKSMLSLSLDCLSLRLQRELRSSQGLLLSYMEENDTKQPVVVKTKSYRHDLGESSRSISPLRELTDHHESQREPYLCFSHYSWRGMGTYHYKSTSRISKNRGIEGQSNHELYIERKFLSSVSFFQRGLAMTSVRSHGNWQYTFTPLRIIPDTDSIWDACAAGDIEMIKEYFRDGYTVYDSSDQGYTLLHAAAAHARPQLCRWLLEQGAKIEVIAGRVSSTPLYSLVVNCTPVWGLSVSSKGPLRVLYSTHDRPVDICDTLRVLVEHGDADPMVGNSFHRTSLQIYNGPIEGYRYLLDYQQAFVIDLEASDDRGVQVIDQKFTSFVTGFETARLTLARLKPENHIHRSLAYGGNFGRVRSDIPSGFTLLHSAIFGLTNIWQIEKPMAEGLLLLDDLLKMGFDVHAVTKNGITPLDYLLDYTYHDLNIWTDSGSGIERIPVKDPSKDLEARELERNKSGFLLAWMRILRNRGIGLHDYWKEEEKLHDGGLVRHCVYVRVGMDRVFSVEYGEDDEVTIKVKDLDAETEVFDLPGAWIEDDTYMNGDGHVVMHGLKSRADWDIDSRRLKDEKESYTY